MRKDKSAKAKKSQADSAEPVPADSSAQESADSKQAATAQATPTTHTTPTTEGQEDFQERYLLALAELRNISARHEKALGEARKRGAEPLAQDLLDALDNLKRAREAPECSESVRGGLDLVLRGIEEAFARHGIVPFASVGAKLDPSRHEVMAELPTAEQPAGTVVQEVQGGWLIHGRLLRAARVVVARAEKPATEAEATETPPEDSTESPQQLRADAP